MLTDLRCHRLPGDASGVWQGDLVHVGPRIHVHELEAQTEIILMGLSRPLNETFAASQDLDFDLDFSLTINLLFSVHEKFYQMFLIYSRNLGWSSHQQRAEHQLVQIPNQLWGVTMAAPARSYLRGWRPPSHYDKCCCQNQPAIGGKGQ